VNNFQEAEHIDNIFGVNSTEPVSFAPSGEAGNPSLEGGGRAYSEEELGYRATCEESYDIMAKTIAIYANNHNALYAF
jgi:hypothetical protein